MNIFMEHSLKLAQALAEALRAEEPDLILTGLQSDDQGFGQTGVVLAELLGIVHSTIIMEVKLDSNRKNEIRVKRELEAGWFQWITIPTPALLTIQSGINQLRYATLKGIMAAKKKEIRKVVADSSLEPTMEISKIYVPIKSKKTRFIEGPPSQAAEELVRILRDEARVF